MTSRKEGQRRPLRDSEVLARAEEFEAKKRAALDTFLTETARLGEDGKDVGPDIAGFESFYRTTGGLLQVLRRVATAETPIYYYQDWSEVSFRVCLPTDSSHARVRYFLETSYFHNALVGTPDVEKRYRLYRGEWRNPDFLKERMLEEGASPKFFEEPSSYVEHAATVPQSQTVVDAVLSRGLRFQPGTGLVDLNFQSKKEGDDGSPMKLVPPSEVERVNRRLALIDVGRDKVKLKISGEA